MGITKPDNLIDLSANINPLGPPEYIEKNWMNFFRKINDYPDPYASRLKEVIVEREKIEKESILIGNGGAELIFLLARALTGKKVLIIEPTFSEYEKACKVNDCQIFYHHIQESDWRLDIKDITKKLSGIDAIFLCNPNNPTGVYYPYETVANLLKACKETNTMLVIDEAFYDFVEEYTPIVPLIHKYKNLVILRSMTKMFAIPGIRLGYVMADPSVISEIATYQPHWSVNALALGIGELCLKDEVFIPQSIDYINKERAKLFSFFKVEGFDVSPSSVNFYLLRELGSDSIIPLYTYLLKKGIVARHTFNFPGLKGKWLRFAIKGTKENEQLMEALREWKKLN